MLADVFTFALQNGLPQQTLLFLLLLPTLATLLVFFRIIIGVEPLPLVQGIVLSLAIWWVGLRYGLFLFGLAFVTELLMYTLLKGAYIFPVARQVISISFTTLMVLTLFLVSSYLTKSSFIALDILPVLLIIVNTQSLLQLHPGDHPLKLLFWLSGMLGYLASSFSLLNSSWVREVIQTYPFGTLGGTFLLLLLLSRFKGLRIVEFFRFSRILRKEESS